MEAEGDNLGLEPTICGFLPSLIGPAHIHPYPPKLMSCIEKPFLVLISTLTPLTWMNRDVIPLQQQQKHFLKVNTI